MEIITKYALDLFEIENTWKTISVRSRIQKYVSINGVETLIDGNVGFHRITITPGDWSGADFWGVRDYANICWSQDVIDAWNQKISQDRFTQS